MSTTYPIWLDPSQSSENQLIMSPHYKLVIDLSEQPLHPNKIIDSEYLSTLVRFFEKLRPVNRVAHYNLFVSPKTDTSTEYKNNTYSGRTIDLYDTNSYTAYMRTRNVNYTNIVDGAFISEFNPTGTEWNIVHDLNSDVLHVMAIDDDYNPIFPNYIEIVNINNIILHFEDEVSGYALLKMPDVIVRNTNTASPWITIVHDLDQKYVYTQIFDINKKIDDLPSDGPHLIDADTLDPDPDYGYAGISKEYVYTGNASTASSTWTIDHNLFTRLCLVMVFDNSGNRIFYDNIEYVDSSQLIITFDGSVSGYAVVLGVGSITDLDTLKNDAYLILNDTQTNPDWSLTREYTDYDEQYKYEIVDAWEEGDWIYLRFDVGLGVSIDVVEMAVVNRYDSVYFFTECSPIEKIEDTDMNVLYRIYQGTLS